MIFGFLRLFFFVFIAMLVVYFVLSWWSRSVCRTKLEEEWEREAMSGDKDAFVEQGLAEYDGSLRRKLIYGVFIIPYVIIAVLIYIVNFQ